MKIFFFCAVSSGWFLYDVTVGDKWIKGRSISHFYWLLRISVTP